MFNENKSLAEHGQSNQLGCTAETNSAGTLHQVIPNEVNSINLQLLCFLKNFNWFF